MPGSSHLQKNSDLWYQFVFIYLMTNSLSFLQRLSQVGKPDDFFFHFYMIKEVFYCGKYVLYIKSWALCNKKMKNLMEIVAT